MILPEISEISKMPEMPRISRMPRNLAHVAGLCVQPSVV